jgi:hypothetical protein
MALTPGTTLGPDEVLAAIGAEQAQPVQGDPGLPCMVVIDECQFRVLRDYAETQ